MNFFFIIAHEKKPHNKQQPRKCTEKTEEILNFLVVFSFRFRFFSFLCVVNDDGRIQESREKFPNELIFVALLGNKNSRQNRDYTKSGEWRNGHH